uniref:Uncharacterized protein n=1 Tax=uncultured marine virus TaxID=186617 RepID=A0A0F7L8U6_9VIRU|nr:hypothetical protein [uncultured marine virus]
MEHYYLPEFFLLYVLLISSFHCSFKFFNGFGMFCFSETFWETFISCSFIPFCNIDSLFFKFFSMLMEISLLSF